MVLAKLEEHNNGAGHSHFLVVAYSMQGHINPARTLARRLARIGSSIVTLSVPISGHRCMFPSIKTSDEEVDDGVISYIPFSDGKDDGSWSKTPEERRWRREESSRSLSTVVGRLSTGGRPVTCMVCTLSMLAAVDVARKHKIPLAIYWIEPATALLTYYHYFHGYDELISSHVNNPTHKVILPGLNPLRICDMPTFFIEKMHNEQSKMFLKSFQELFEYIDKEKPVVMVNTYDALEHTIVKAIQPHMDVFVVGPMVPPLGALKCQEACEMQIHLFKKDERNYMEWLSMQPEKSVVYLSFGSLLTYTNRQVEEILHGLQGCGRPYLWVVRKEGRSKELDLYLEEMKEGKGMVVEWCDQQQVLTHPSIGCFVTHCGWNSALEAIVYGVPMVAVPCWSDQPLNAHLIEKEWGVGVRAERDAEGVLTRMELASCIELLMGDNEKATKIKENANDLKERAQYTLATNGILETNLRSFVMRLQDRDSRQQG
ncbi:hypothetical protein ACP70R_047817 [Stipagrostis hirtigluma subsp. patula]